MLKVLQIYNIRTMSDIKITNYNRSKIYMIYCEDEGVDEIYVGSSVNLKDRIKSHKSNCNDINGAKYNLKLYVYIRDNFGWNNFTVKTLERYSCKNKKELRLREQEWIDELKPTLNNYRAHRTLEDHKNDMLIYYKKYYQENKVEKKQIFPIKSDLTILN